MRRLIADLAEWTLDRISPMRWIGRLLDGPPPVKWREQRHHSKMMDDAAQRWALVAFKQAQAQGPTEKEIAAAVDSIKEDS